LAGYGQEAVELFGRKKNIALVLTDIVMPRKDGVALIRELRAIKPGLPVVAMSGHLPQWEKELDGVACIAKPFRMETLLEELEKRLGNGNDAGMRTVAA
jgi:CheY-like chemotaxis protein